MSERSAEELATMAREATRRARPLYLIYAITPARVCWAAALADLNPDLATVEALIAVTVAHSGSDFGFVALQHGRWQDAVSALDRAVYRERL